MYFTMKTSFNVAICKQLFAAVSIVFAFSVTIGAQSNSLRGSSVDIIHEYEKKTCEAKRSCNATEDVQNLKVRNCMCDENCVLYDDCCENSLFRNGSAAHVNVFKCVNTAVDGNVYMITSCPALWNETSSIVQHCNQQIHDPGTIDPLLSTPVTSSARLITYRNLFCAICHNESEFVFWGVLIWYEKIEELEISQLSATTNLVNYTVENTKNTTTSAIESVITNASMILSTMKFNENHSWQFPLNDTWKDLYLYEIAPQNLSTQIRYCVPRVIDSCPANQTDPQILTKCASYTSYVNARDTVYKNKYCAKCHNVTLDESKTCRNETVHDFVYDLFEPFIVKIEDERLSVLKRNCYGIPNNLRVYGSVCLTTKATSQYIPSCFPKNKHYNPAKVCLVYRATNKNDTDITFVEDDNALIFLGTRYIIGEDAFYGKGDSITICGTYKTPSSPILYKIEEILTYVLINVSIVCLILQLIFVQQLKELRNLSGKNLACFSFTLLIFYICYNFGPTIRTWFQSCAFTAILSHYCSLSCFVWMFVMSYDCWLSLYRATSQFRTSGGKHTVKFSIYCIISWCSPLPVLGYALYLEYFMPRTFETCKSPVPGYGLDPSCWILREDAKLYLHFIPMSTMVVGNVFFFAHTVCMIYGNKRNSVNPNTQNDFKIYSRLALLMGLTWTLGILNNLTDGEFSDFIGVVYDLMNMSQGALIFFVFTCKEKTFKLLLTKHKDNKFVSATLLKFLPRNAKDLAMTEMKTNSTDTTI